MHSIVGPATLLGIIFGISFGKSFGSQSCLFLQDRPIIIARTQFIREHRLYEVVSHIPLWHFGKDIASSQASLYLWAVTEVDFMHAVTGHYLTSHVLHQPMPCTCL